MTHSDWLWKIFSLMGVATPILAFVFRNWISEKIRADFQKEIESFKNSLEQQKESFRVQMARETESLTLHKSSISQVYPQLYEKIVIATGNVSGLRGGRFVSDYTKWSRDEIEEHLDRQKTPGDRSAEVLSLFDTDKASLADSIQKIDREKQIGEALTSHQEAKNFLILKSLFVSSPVKEKSFELLYTLNVVIIEIVHLQKDGDWQKARDAINASTPLCNELEKTMRAEIFTHSDSSQKSGVLLSGN